MSEKETNTGGHHWVQIEECVELADGAYVVTWGDGESLIAYLTDEYGWEMDLSFVEKPDHILNPHLGPIPDAPEVER